MRCISLGCTHFYGFVDDHPFGLVLSIAAVVVDADGLAALVDGVAVSSSSSRPRRHQQATCGFGVGFQQHLGAMTCCCR